MSKPKNKECPESISGHDNGDRAGKCNFCGKKVNTTLPRPTGLPISDLSEAYAQHWDPDWDGGK
jgi:hypothetical protein